MNPTPEQLAILDAAKNRTESLLIRAMAGTGKTTTLEMIANVIKEPGFALAFNRSTKETLEKRFPSHFSIKTFNGLGHVAFSKAIDRRCEVDDKKLGRLVTQTFKTLNWKGEEDDWHFTRALVSKAMGRGLVPEGAGRGLVPDTEETWEDLMFEVGTQNLDLAKIARDVLRASIKEALQGKLSYDDQIYMSALFGGIFPRSGLVLVDESQDLNVLNHLQVKKVAAGRLIVVGDERQSIYAFRGADHESIAKLRSLRPNWIELPLATTFRCPKGVVSRQQEHAPGFVAFETNQEGQILDWRINDTKLSTTNDMSDDNLSNDRPNDWNGVRLLKIDPRPTVLCRNNAPLLSLAFKLIREGIGVYMLGREIGKGLEALAKKLLPHQDTSREACRAIIENWITTEVSLCAANGKPEKGDQIKDRGECLLAVLEAPEVMNSGNLKFRLRQLFSKESGQVTLSTGHKAKGLEWDTVLFLDPWRIPPKWAKGPALIQEKNLKYVIETRTKKTLIFANMEDYSNE